MLTSDVMGTRSGQLPTTTALAGVPGLVPDRAGARVPHRRVEPRIRRRGSEHAVAVVEQATVKAP